MCHVNKGCLSEARNRTSKKERRGWGGQWRGEQSSVIQMYENTTKILWRGVEGVGVEKCLDTTKPEVLMAYAPPSSLNVKGSFKRHRSIKDLTLRTRDISEVVPDFGKRFASRCTEDARRL